MDIGVLGFGSTARALVEALQQDMPEIGRRSRHELRLVSVVALTPLAGPVSLPEGCRLAGSLEDVLDDPTIDVVVELVGDVDQARRAVLRALDRRKHVVTTNTALLALHGDEIFSRARIYGAMVGFEGAVAGPVPAVKLLRESQAGHGISALICILGRASKALRVPPHREAAQDAACTGRVELARHDTDPAADGTGDAAHTLTILAALAFGFPMRPHAVHRCDAPEHDVRDARFARESGYCIKQLAIARRHGDEFEMRIGAALLPLGHPMARVPERMNAILLQGAVSGTTLHCGPHASVQATASAILADLLDIARLLDAKPIHQIPLSGFLPDRGMPARTVEPAHACGPRYLRFTIPDSPSIADSIRQALAEQSISINVVRQLAAGSGRAHLVVLTHACAGSDLQRALSRIRNLPTVCRDIVSLPIEPLHQGSQRPLARGGALGETHVTLVHPAISVDSIRT
jgi:homoserine dehydrogenase